MKLVAIKENHLFGKSYAKGKKVVTKLFAVYCLKDYASGKIKKNLRLEEPVNRYGISSSKKVGGAVERNRARRVARHGLYELLKKENVRGGFLVVISVRAAAAKAKSTAAEKELFDAFSRLGLIEEKKIVENAEV